MDNWNINGIKYDIIRVDKKLRRAILKHGDNYAVLIVWSFKKNIPLSECEKVFKTGNIGDSYSIVG